MGSQSIRQLSANFSREWATALLDAESPRYTVIATSFDQLMERLKILESRTQRSLLNMQSRWWIDPHGRNTALDEASLARGVSVTLMVPKRAIELSPLLPSIHPDLWVAPVQVDAMLVDEAVAILSGGLDDNGNHVFCTTADPVLVGTLRSIAGELRRVAKRPAEITGQDPMTPRQVQVALALARGDKDTATARRLATSLRTVEREVSAVVRHLGAKNRQEAALTAVGDRP